VCVEAAQRKRQRSSKKRGGKQTFVQRFVCKQASSSNIFGKQAVVQLLSERGVRACKCAGRRAARSARSAAAAALHAHTQSGSVLQRPQKMRALFDNDASARSHLHSRLH
jgi:hypothetical protein